MAAHHSVRIDKWLCAVRLFKSRTLASEACQSGKVKINGQLVKPSRLIAIGDLVDFKKGGTTHTVKVLELIEKRVGAREASMCYTELTNEKSRKKLITPIAENLIEYRPKGAGRPTKKDRRMLDRLKDYWQ